MEGVEAVSDTAGDLVSSVMVGAVTSGSVGEAMVMLYDGCCFEEMLMGYECQEQVWPIVVSVSLSTLRRLCSSSSIYCSMKVRYIGRKSLSRKKFQSEGYLHLSKNSLPKISPGLLVSHWSNVTLWPSIEYTHPSPFPWWIISYIFCLSNRHP